MATCPVRRGPWGHCLLPTLSAFPPSAYGPRASRLRPATLRPERNWGPAEARRSRERPSGARRRGPGLREGRGLAAPPPASPGGARERPTAARLLPRPAPAAPSPPSRRPSPRPAPPERTPAGRPEPPVLRSSGEPPARACGLVGVT